MARPTDEERSFRRIGAGIPFGRFWAFPTVVIALMFASFTVPGLFMTCTGHPLEDGGKAGALIRMVMSAPCSPYLLREGLWGWTLFLAIWVLVPFGIINWFWQKRHRAYWDRVRARERERRKLRREERRKQKESSPTGA